MARCLESVSKEMLNSEKLFMLSLISSSSEKGWLGITKLQKLTFLIEYELSKKGKRALGYDFYMYDHGPISNSVYSDFEFLLNEEIINEGEQGIQLTKLGCCIEKQITELIPKDLKSVVKEIVNKYAQMSTRDLVKTVHRLQIDLPDGNVMRIDDIPKTCTVLKSSPRKFIIDNDYLETFRIKCDKDLMQSIQKARKGSTSKPYEPLVSS